MKYKEWRLWIKSLPWVLKWFVYLVLVRPLVDNFYFLKNVSPLLSPLYIVGVLTPVLVIITTLQIRKAGRSKFDNIFGIWSFFTITSCLLILVNDLSSLTTLILFLKCSIPFFVFIFLRRLVRSERDFHGILQTVIFSSIFVIPVFLYEVLIHPIELQETRGTLERIQGFYGDSAYYGTYFSMIFICYAYFFLKNKANFRSIRNLTLMTIIFILLLVKIHHAATYIVFSIILLLFFIFNFRAEKGYGVLFLFFIGIFLMFYMNTIMEKSVNPLFERDIKAYNGEIEEDQFLHGRYGRWKGIFEWWPSMPMEAKFLGLPLTFDKSMYWLYGQSGTHNDFIRILMISGIFGLGSYFLVLIRALRKILLLKKAKLFIGLSTFALLFLYSISLTPTMYAPVMYFVLTIFAYASLPLKFQNDQAQNNFSR